VGSKFNAKFWQSILFYEIQRQLIKITGGFSFWNKNEMMARTHNSRRLQKKVKNTCLSPILLSTISHQNGHFLVSYSKTIVATFSSTVPGSDQVVGPFLANVVNFCPNR
jgi:hypothetical protein